MHQQCLTTGIEDHRGSVGLVAVDHELILRLAWMRGDAIDGVGHSLRRKHGLEAYKGDMRGDKEQRRGEGYGRCRFESGATTPQPPCRHWPEQQCQSCDDRG